MSSFETPVRNFARTVYQPVEPFCDCPEGTADIFEDRARDQYVCRVCGVTDDRHRPSTVDPEPNAQGSFSQQAGLERDEGWYGSSSGGTFQPPAKPTAQQRRWTRYSRRRSNPVVRVMKEVGWIKNRMGLAQDLTMAVGDLYRKALHERSFPGISYKMVAAAFMYLVAKRTNYPLNLDELVNLFEQKDHSKLRRLILHTSEFVSFEGKWIQRFWSGEVFVSSVAELFRFPFEVQLKSHQMLQTFAKRKLLVGKRPIISAAAAVYLSALQLGLAVSQEELAQSVGISTVALRGRVKAFCKYLRLETVPIKRGPLSGKRYRSILANSVR